jgi:hypothetical protein
MKKLKGIVKNDPRINKLKRVVPCVYDKDPNHLQRRMQSKAISLEMIKIALGYGVSHRHSNTKVYRLGDRHLKDSCYEKFVDKLRGLKVVTLETPEEFKVISAYWLNSWK